ncbi:hypothetical protein TrVGV298_002386 [Trichoderma virens]|nr:hypothetical protein TrVGV298_002386 [Trichoderma virens]
MMAPVAFCICYILDTLLRHARGHQSQSNRQLQENQQNGKSSPRPNSLNGSVEAVPRLVTLSQATDHSSGNSASHASQGAQAGLSPLTNVAFAGVHQIAPSVTPAQPDLAGFSAPANPTWSTISPSTDNHLDSLNNVASADLNLDWFNDRHGDEVFQETFLNLQTPVWQMSADFELNVFQPSIIDTPFGFPLDDFSQPQLEQMYLPFQSSQDASPPREDSVRQHWFTFLGPHQPENIMQDAVGEKTKVDETFRAGLSQRLLARVPAEPLPSVDFLNLCIQMYFTRFNPIFPIIHAPTFRPSAKSSLLLLSICSLGSLFLSSPFAIAQGQRIFERLNKAMMASNKWENVLSSGKLEAVAMTQAGVIGQTYAMLSGRPKDLLLAQGLHGTVITWARRCGIFRDLSKHEGCITPDDDVRVKWTCWAKREEHNRVATALYIHDAEHSAIFKTEPLMRHAASKLPPLCSDSLWAASTAEEWEKLAGNATQTVGALQSPPSQHGHPPNLQLPMDSANHEKLSFRVYCELEGITASISEDRVAGTLADTLKQHELTLLRFHHRYIEHGSNKGDDPFCVEILWHLAFMTLFADINELEIAAGREGYEQSRRQSERTKAWALSHSAQRCAIHGALILQKAEKMCIGVEPAIHVPRAMFCAALIWYCYAEYGQDNADEVATRKPEFPEFRQLGISGERVLFEAHGFKSMRPTRLKSIVTTGLHDLLGRMGHWGISRKFASLIVYMVYGDVQGNYREMANTPENGG